MAPYMYSQSIEELKAEIIEKIKISVRRLGKNREEIKFIGRAILFKQEMFGKYIAVHETQELIDNQQQSTGLNQLSVEELAQLLDDINKERFEEKKFSLRMVFPATLEIDFAEADKEHIHELLRSGKIKTVKDVKDLFKVFNVNEFLSLEQDSERVLEPDQYQDKATIEMVHNPTEATKKWKVIYKNNK